MSGQENISTTKAPAQEWAGARGEVNISDPDWLMDLRPGDVIRTRKSGDLRVVRSVHHHLLDCYPWGYRTAISLVIRRCSWTRRCYTTYVGNAEIRWLFAPTGIRVALEGKMDLQIEQQINSKEILLTCCSVRSIP